MATKFSSVYLCTAFQTIKHQLIIREVFEKKFGIRFLFLFEEEEMRSQSLVSTVTPNHKPKTNEELEDVIPWGVWKATFLIGTQSFTYGYVLSAIGSTLQFGDDHNGTYCNRGEDSTCDRGTIYKDINLSDGRLHSLPPLFSFLSKLSKQ